MTKLSIAMCTYNGAEYLREQLDSFAAQSVLPDELIVCDDGSTDATVAILKEFAASAAFAVKIYENERNLGYIKNFEQAIGLCTGEIIFLSDQDDVWHAEKLKMFADAFDADASVGMVFCDGELVDERLDSLGAGAWQARLFDEKKRSQLESGGGLEIILKDNVVSGCMMAFRARYLNNILPIPTDIPGVIHDYWITIILLTETKVKIFPQKLVKYRQHSRQQLGLSSEEPGTLREQAAKNYDFPQQQQKYEQLSEYLSRRFDALPLENQQKRKIVLSEVERQIKHFRARVNIADKKTRRARLIFDELISRRYHKYSNGWRSAAKDLSLYLTK